MVERLIYYLTRFLIHTIKKPINRLLIDGRHILSQTNELTLFANAGDSF